MFPLLSGMLILTVLRMWGFINKYDTFVHTNFPISSSLYHVDCWDLVAPAELFFYWWGHPSVCPIVTPHMLLLRHWDFIQKNSTNNNAVIPLVAKFKLLMNINKWIAHVQEKQFTTTPKSDQWFPQGHAWYNLQYTPRNMHMLRAMLYFGLVCYLWPLLLTWINFNPSMDK